jgi:hypothetical protein
MDLIPLHSNAWVEMHEDHAVVSWPGGLRVIDYDDPVVVLLGAISWAIKDILAERPTKAEVREDRTKHYDQGFDAGWKAYEEHAQRRGTLQAG